MIIQNAQQFLDGLGIGYAGSQGCGFTLGSTYKLSPEEKNTLLAQGETMREWLTTSIELVNRATRGEEGLAWLTNLVEGESSVSVVEVHRRAHLSGRLGVPTFARPDMSEVGQSVEVQIPGSGWGYQQAIHQTVDGSAWAGLVNAFSSASGSKRSGYILYNDPFRAETEYFCNLCRNAGVDLQLYFQYLPDSEVGFVRRPPLEDLLSYSGGAEMVDRWLKGEISIEPGPSLLFDQKLPMLFPFHPLLREYFPDKVRALFPETYLIERGKKFLFYGEEFGLENFSKMSGTERKYILKYGGSKKGLRAGGKGVYNLMDLSQSKTQTLLDMACVDWETNRSPWVIQKMIRKKYPVKFLEKNGVEGEKQYCGLFRPMYMFPQDQPAKLVSCIAVFRPTWKVHGAIDCVISPVEP